jgi:hypothetical protein
MGLLRHLKLDWRPGRGLDLDVTARQGRAREWVAIPLTGKTRNGRHRKVRKGASIRF